jgi:hypothetical protein
VRQDFRIWDSLREGQGEAFGYKNCNLFQRLSPECFTPTRMYDRCDRTKYNHDRLSTLNSGTLALSDARTINSQLSTTISVLPLTMARVDLHIITPHRSALHLLPLPQSHQTQLPTLTLFLFCKTLVRMQNMNTSGLNI